MSEELSGHRFAIKSKFLWHSSQIYCLAFDRKGKHIFTGGDDGVLRVYSIAKDRLIRSLSDQKTNEFADKVEEVCRTIDFAVDTEPNIEALLEQFAICDVAVNHENTLVSAGKNNGSILVWNLQTFDLIVKFEEQMFPIRSVIFGAAVFDDNKKYLISTSEDGFMFFYVYNYQTLKFEPKSLHRRSKYDGERAVNICVDMTAGGLLLGLMHTFGAKQEASKPKSKKEPLIKCDVQSAIRLFSLSDEMGLKEEWKTIYHKSHTDCVYSLRFSHNTFRFASACDKDTNAFIWTYDKGNKKWDSIIIGINTKGETKKLLRGKSKQSPEESVFVDEIVFSCDDKYMITVLTDVSIKVWNSESGELVQHFHKNHTKKISVVDCHPTYGHIFVSAGYDSNIFIYDVIKNTILQHFDCSLKTPVISGNSPTETSLLVKPLLLQCSFSPDGQAMAATDNFGNLTVFSLESRKEADCLDQLEEVLFRMHSETEEENCLTAGMTITASEEDSKLIKAMFEYETDLLKGIERPSPLKVSQNGDEKKFDVKTVPNLVLETNSGDSQTNKVKPIPKVKAKAPKKPRTPAKKSLTSSSQSKVDSPKPSEKGSTSGTPVKGKPSVGGQTKPMKQLFREILDEIFDNPSSRPFQINDELQYPTFRKEISDADLCLTTIREDILLNSRYGFAKFNKDMNKVIENAKTFYKHTDEDVYDMAIIFEKFYCNKMEQTFGTAFKPPQMFDSSEEEMSDQSTTVSKPTTTPIKEVPKQLETTRLRSQSVDSTKEVKDSPKVNGKPGSERKPVSSDKKSKAKNSGSERKRINTTTIEKSGSDTEPTPRKRTKVAEKLSNSSAEKDSDVSAEDTPNDDMETDIAVDTVAEDVVAANHKVVEVGTDLITEDESQSDDYLKGQSNDFGVEAEKEIQESISKPESVVNGNQSEINSCNNRTQSTPPLKNCLFCIFCEKIFWSLSEAKSHYIHHLSPLKCSNCDQLFTSYDQYLSDDHQCGHPKTPANLDWCRQYSDSVIWLEKFLDYQQTEDIEKFETMGRCVVCDKVCQFRPEAQNKTKEIKPMDPNSHLQRHLKYVPQYQCLFCLLNHDKYFYVTNTDEAEQHLSKEHRTHQTTGSTALQYFDGSIPKLDEIILKINS